MEVLWNWNLPTNHELSLEEERADKTRAVPAD